MRSTAMVILACAGLVAAAAPLGMPQEGERDKPDAASQGLAAPQPGDTLLSIKQIPDEKRGRESRLDTALLPANVPERCADPAVAASDPACIPDTALNDLYRALGIPLIQDAADQPSPIVPGVTINKPQQPRLPD